MLDTVRRGQLFTGSEIFGFYRDGKCLRKGWQSILGLCIDDIKVVMVDLQPTDLSTHEQWRQNKARADSKAKLHAPTIRRAIRFQIENHVFDRAVSEHDPAQSS